MLHGHNIGVPTSLTKGKTDKILEMELNVKFFIRIKDIFYSKTEIREWGLTRKKLTTFLLSRTSGSDVVIFMSKPGCEFLRYSVHSKPKLSFQIYKVRGKPLTLRGNFYLVNVMLSIETPM